MNINIFNLRDLQQFLALLNEAEGAGVTDVRFLRQRIQNHIEKTANTGRVRPMRVARQQRPSFQTCPSCEKGLLMPVINREGLKIVGCKKCRYSKVVV